MEPGGGREGGKAGGSRQPLPPGSPRPGRAPQPLPPRPRLPVPGLPAPTHAYGQRPGPHDRPAAGPAPAARPERAPAFPGPRRPPQGGRLGSAGTARPAGPARPAACGGSGACPLPLPREPPGGLCEEGEGGISLTKAPPGHGGRGAGPAAGPGEPTPRHHRHPRQLPLGAEREAGTARLCEGLGSVRTAGLPQGTTPPKLASSQVTLVGPLAWGRHKAWCES